MLLMNLADDVLELGVNCQHRGEHLLADEGGHNVLGGNIHNDFD